MLLTWKSALPKSFGVAAHRTNASLLTADGGHDGRCLGRAEDRVNAREQVCRRPPGASGKTRLTVSRLSEMGITIASLFNICAHLL